MKFNHIIYNSSQINRNGTPGFGERAVTIGIDPDLLKAINEKRNDFYGFSYSHPKITPPSLKDDPSLIRLISPSYMFRAVEYGNKKAWVVSRKIAVGFDYSFYTNGNPTRLGAYVVDLYLFDSVPPREAFEAVYENPAPGSVHFIPASPEPTTGNDEMKAICLGKPEDFPQEDKSFKAASLPDLDARAIKLLFAFYAHLTEGKPVAIAIDDADATDVIGSFMRLVPDELLSRATYFTNFNGTGIPEGVALACIDPDRANYFPAMTWIKVDLTADGTFASAEASQLQGECEKALADGDIPHLLNLVRWLFSSEYRSVKAQDEPAREIAFRYVIEPQTVTDSVIAKALADDVTVKALVTITGNGASAAILDRYFDAQIAASGSVTDIKAVLDSLLALDAKGLHCAKDALKRASAHIDSVVLASASSLEEFYRLAGAVGPESLTGYAEFLNLDSLKKDRNAFLSDLRPASWRRLYSLFFDTPVDGKALARRAVTDRLPEAELSAFLFETISSDRLVDIAVALILENDKFSASMLPVLSQLQDSGIAPQGKRYFDIFATKRDSAEFAEIMVKEYAKSIPLSPVEKEIERIGQLSAHPCLVRAISDVKLSGVLKSLKSAALSAGDNAAAVAALCDRLCALNLKSHVIADVKLLADVLRGSYNADALKVAVVGVETGREKAVMAVLPKLASTKIDGSIIDGIVGFLHEKSVDRTEVAGIVYKAAPKQLSAWFPALYANEKKHRGNIIVAELQQAGLPVEKAVEILETALPDDHKAYLKSLQPGIFTRFVNWVSGLFSRKTDKQASKEAEPKQQADSDKKRPESQPSANRQSARPSDSSDMSVKQNPSDPSVNSGKPAQSMNTGKSEQSTPSGKPELSEPSRKPETSTPDSRSISEVPAPAPDPNEVVENEGEIKLD